MAAVLESAFHVTKMANMHTASYAGSNETRSKNGHCYEILT
jgi:hypothetical protein